MFFKRQNEVNILWLNFTDTSDGLKKKRWSEPKVALMSVSPDQGVNGASKRTSPSEGDYALKCCHVTVSILILIHTVASPRQVRCVCTCVCV